MSPLLASIHRHQYAFNGMRIPRVVPQIEQNWLPYKCDTAAAVVLTQFVLRSRNPAEGDEEEEEEEEQFGHAHAQVPRPGKNKPFRAPHADLSGMQCPIISES